MKTQVHEAFDGYTTVSDAAKELGIPFTSVYYHVLNGDIERHQLGSVMLVDMEEARRVMGVLYQPRKRKDNVA